MSNNATYVPPCSEAMLRRMYVQNGMSQVEIADALRTTQKVIWTAMRRYNIPRRPQIKRNQRGPKNDYWRGGRIQWGAYIYVLDPTHPHSTKNGYVAEHIQVALIAADRAALHSDEHVHHIDLDKHNNDPSNLVIGARQQHGAWHASLQREAAKLMQSGKMAFDPVEGYTLRQ